MKQTKCCFALMLFFISFSGVLPALEPEKSFFIINFGGTIELPVKGWGNTGKYEDIFKWGLDKDLNLIADDSPVVDNTASFVAKNGSSVELANLGQRKRYIMWVDFVRFKVTGKKNISSRLEVFADSRKIGDFTWGNLPQTGYVPVEIPDDISFKGNTTISFREFSANTGLWGVWDIIVAENGKFPDDLEISAQNSPPPVKEVKQEMAKKKKKFSSERKPAEVKPLPAVKKEDEKVSDPPRVGETDPLKKAVSDSLKEKSDGKIVNPDNLEIVEPVPPLDPMTPQLEK